MDTLGLLFFRYSHCYCLSVIRGARFISLTTRWGRERLHHISIKSCLMIVLNKFVHCRQPAKPMQGAARVNFSGEPHFAPKTDKQLL